MPQLFILLFLAIAAYGQMQQRVAVINTLDDGEPPIKNLELTYLTDKLRETASNVLPKEQYGVMTTESIVAFFGSHERLVKVCNESSCLVDLGRKVSADYVAQAMIGRFGKDLTIRTELYDTKSGTLVGSFTGNSKDIYGLLTLIDEKAPDLFKKLLISPSSPSTPPPAVAFSKTPQPETEPEVVQEEQPDTDDEPYESPEEMRLARVATANRKRLNSFSLGIPDWLQFGIRAGININDNINYGPHFGLVLNIAVNERFYIQPGLMYIGKENTGYLKLPLLLSFKFSAFKIDTGPYFGTNVYNLEDFGLSVGMGFDIGMFYIGAFYDHSLQRKYFNALGLNVGVNL